MVLPLLGLLALGGVAAGAPALRNRDSRIKGQYQAGVLEGVDQSDPNATRSALFGGGLLEGPQFQADSRTAFEGQAGRQQSDINSRRSAGSAAAALAQRVREFDYNVEASEAQAEQMRMSAQWTMENFGTEQQQALANNPFATPQQMDALATEVQAQAMKTIDTGPIIQQFRDQSMGPSRRLDKGNQILEIVGDASVFDSWVQDPANRNAKLQVERMAFELRQDWIDDQVSQGREPSEALQERAERLFPTDIGALDNRQVFLKNLTSYMSQQQTELERLQTDFTSQLNGNPLNILNTFNRTIPGQVNAADVIPD